MASLSTKKYEAKLEELIDQIKIMKLALEGKYGPHIKSKWAKRKIYDDKLVIPT